MISDLAVGIIHDAFVSAFSKPSKNKIGKLSRRAAARREAARQWLLDPSSNLSIYAGVLGKSADYYRRRARRLLDAEKA